MKKNTLGIICFLILSFSVTIESSIAQTSKFVQHFESGQAYLAQGQYSSAIESFRRAVAINFMDNSARIGLINSYLARATYYANQEKNYEKSANDFRSALFYLKIFPTKEQTVQNSAVMIASATDNLNQCLKVMSFDRTPSARYKKAEELKSIGNFSAASFEFIQAAQNESLAAKSYEQVGDLLKVLRNEPRSADYYQLALEQAPTNSMLRLKFARTLDKLGRGNEAVEQYNAALMNSKNDKEVLFALERLYTNKLAERPSDAELYANIGAIKQAQGDFESALSYYGKAEQLNPTNINTRLNVGTLFQEKKDYLKALKSYDSVLTLYPDNIQANLYKAKILSEMGNKKESLELYNKVLKLDPANAIAKAEVIDVMEASMTPAEYVQYLVEKAPSDVSVQSKLYNYAYKLHKENKIKEAISAYESVIKVNSENVDAYVNLAICYASQNNYKNAQSILNEAKSKFPTNNLVLKTLQDVNKDSLSTILAEASKLYENKDYNSAIQKYSMVNPATKDSLLGIAASYQALNNYDNAIDYYKKVENLTPNNYEIPYYIGYLYSELQKWSEAELYLKKSIQLEKNINTENLLAYVMQNLTTSELNSAIALYDKKELQGALTKFNDILKRDANNVLAYYYRGLIYDDQKKYNLALDDYSKFLSKYTTEDEYLQYIKSRVEELKTFATGG